MPLRPKEIYECELAAYEAAKANYEKAVTDNPAIAMWLDNPKKPVMSTTSLYWSMRGVVTASRRNWKRG